MTDRVAPDILRRMTRAFIITLKSLAVLLVILLIVAAAGAWRLTSDPITATRLTPYIESVFERLVPNTIAHIGASSIEWDNKKLTLLLSCEDVTLNNEKGAPVLSFPSASLKLSLGSYLRGRVLPQEFKANRAHFWLVRDEKGTLSFGTVQEGESVKEDAAPIDVFSFLQGLADEVSNERLRHTIAIQDVTLSIQDIQSKQKWDISVPEITLNHNRKESNANATVLLSEKDRTSSLKLAYHYDYKERRHQVDLSFQDIRLASFVGFSPDLALLSGADFPVSGRVNVRTDNGLDIVSTTVRLDGGAGNLIYANLWDKPRSLSRFAFEANYDRKKESLNIPVAEIDFGGPKLSLEVNAKTPVPDDLMWLSRKKENNSFTVKVMLDNVPMDQYGALWPKVIIPDARNWIERNMSKGVFTHGEVTINGRVKLDDIENLTLESGGGFIDAKGARVSYLDGMPAVDDASAHATFDLEHMDVQILAGQTGPVKLLPFTIVMDRFQEDVQYITIPARLQGPISNVLQILDAPPLGYAKEIGLDPTDSVGTVEGVLTLHMPMLDALLLKDVEVKAEAKLKGFGAKKLVPGIELSQGVLDLDVTKDGFGLKGGIVLNGVVSNLAWKSNFHTDGKQPLHEGTVKADVKDAQWDAFYGLGKLIKVQGVVPTTVVYKNVRKGLSTVEGSIDLKRAAVAVKDIAWQKPADQSAQASFVLEMEEGQNLIFKNIDLQGKGVKVKGTAELDHTTSQLIALNMNPFVVGRSNATIDYLKPVDPALPLSITVRGNAFDTSGLESEDQDEKEKNRPRNYDLKVTKLFTSEKGFMGSFSGHARRDKEGWRDIDLWGIAQGSVPVSINLTQREGRSVFDMKSDNFGAALQGLGLTDGIRGGTLIIQGEGTEDNPRAIEGEMKATSFVVSDLPILARLLSAVSPFGFMDLITGEASFDRIKGKFKWQGDQIDLREVRAAGSVVGINLDGRIDTAADQLNLSGTLVPFSFMNSIIGSIPLLGDVITGGEGQGVIAAAFTVKGPLAAPEISVNPVSLLAPGFLRNIFFAGEDLTEEKNIEKPASLDSVVPQK